MSPDEIKADLATIEAARRARNHTCINDNSSCAFCNLYDGALDRWPVALAEVQRLQALADKYHHELQEHWTAELDAQSEVQRLRAALKDVAGHGVTLPIEVEAHADPDFFRGYRRGIDSQRAIALAALGKETT